LTQVRKQPTTNKNVIAARIERDFHDVRFRLTQRSGHDDFSTPTPRRLGNWVMISSTMFSCGSSRD
jgi:3-isopropylmalate dehydratase small subunit